MLVKFGWLSRFDCAALIASGWLINWLVELVETKLTQEIYFIAMGFHAVFCHAICLGAASLPNAQQQIA